MEENIKKYHLFGTRTLFMFILQKSGIFFLFLLVLFVSLFLLSYVPSDYIDTAVNIILIYSLIVLVVLAAVFSVAWLQYSRYWIFVDDKDLKIARGLISTEQIGIPYRHIQDIKIERSLTGQMFGVSDIIITVSGSEGEQQAEKESTIILPFLPKEVALQIQDIVLKKAQVEQVNILNGAQKII